MSFCEKKVEVFMNTDKSKPKPKKTKECIKCKKFFDCDGMPQDADRCVVFEERKK